MRSVLRISTRMAALVLTFLGLVSLAALLRGSDSEFIGLLLITPAIRVGLLGLRPGVLFKISEGWPVLTAAGVVAIYIVPAFICGVAAKRWS